MEPYRRRVSHRLLAGLLAVLTLGALWSAVDASTRPPDGLPGAVRILALDSSPDAPVRAAWAHAGGDRVERSDRALPVDHRDEGRYGWLRGDRLENAAQARSWHERGPRPLDVTVPAGLAPGIALVVFARRAHRRRVLVAGAAAGTPTRGPPSLLLI